MGINEPTVMIGKLICFIVIFGIMAAIAIFFLKRRGGKETNDKPESIEKVVEIVEETNIPPSMSGYSTQNWNKVGDVVLTIWKFCSNDYNFRHDSSLLEVIPSEILEINIRTQENWIRAVSEMDELRFERERKVYELLGLSSAEPIPEHVHYMVKQVITKGYKEPWVTPEMDKNMREICFLHNVQSALG